MLIDIILLLVGFALLIVGADTLVRGASSLASRLNVPNMVIGLTIVAIGTSAPELVVNVISAIKKETALAFGNVVGSNIFNILCVLGITSMVRSININKNTTKIEIPMIVFSSLLLLFMMGVNINKESHFQVSRIEGIVLLLFFFIFLAYTFRLAKSDTSEEIEIKTYSLFYSVLFIVLGLAGLIVGGKLLVDGAVNIAKSIGIPERIIAITIISVGTSLPELATSIAAARRNNVDMAVGNVVGSNLINVFLVLGISSIITPVNISSEALIDIGVNIFASLLLFLFVFTGKGRKIERWEGILFFLIYVVYIVYLVIYQLN